MRVLVCGGTHGDELAGVWVASQVHAGRPEFAREGLDVTGLVANPAAVSRGTRFVGSDLNRAFGGRESRGPEAELARALAPALASVDFVIDLHSSTADAGLTLCLPTWGDSLSVECALATAAACDGRLLVEGSDDATVAGDGALCAAASHGLEIEVGGTRHGVLSESAVRATLGALHAALDFLSSRRAPRRPVPVFRHVGRWEWPTDALGVPAWLVRRDVRDYAPLRVGQPVFETRDGEVVRYAGEEGVCAVFVNEAAYYRRASGLGLGLARFVGMAVTADEVLAGGRARL